jgi:bacteriochlorophyll 4-vinyl reductase
MNDMGVGRLLVASLHQGIADLLPTRLEFYESWLNPAGLRDGRIGLAPLAAVLSFLRQEGEPYQLVAARAGEYTAEWWVADMQPMRRTLIRALPPAIRLRLVLSLARQMVRSTSKSSRAVMRWRKGQLSIDIRGSIFCEVREKVKSPLCEFYAAAIRRLMHLFSLEADVGTDQCRATGSGQCVMSVLVRPVSTAGTAGAAG